MIRVHIFAGICIIGLLSLPVQLAPVPWKIMALIGQIGTTAVLWRRWAP